MGIAQLSVFVENKPGRLRAVASALASGDINLRALTVAETMDFGVLRMIVDQHEAAKEILQKNGFVVQITNVIAVEMADEPGELLSIVTVLEEKNINIAYMYAFKSNKALLVFKVDDEVVATQALRNKGFRVIDEQADFLQDFGA